MRLVIAGLLLMILAAGPAYPQKTEILQLQKDMIDVQQWVKQLQATMDKNDAVLTGLVEKIADQVNTLAGGMQKINQAVEGLKGQNDTSSRDMRTISTTLSTVNSTLKELQDEVSSARAQLNSVSKEIRESKTTAEPLAGPNDIWRSAFVDYSAGNYDLAISGYQEFLQKFPEDSRAAEAHLQIANALVGQKKLEPAITEYDFVLQKYPDSDKSRTALLKKGLAQAEASQPQQAIATLNEVVKKFPNTSEAASAQARLRELQQPARRTPAPAPNR